MRTKISDLPNRAAFIPAKNGDEQDATSRKARRFVACLNRAGTTTATKTLMRRRDRRATRQILASY